LFVLFYGDPLGADATRVRAVKPNFVVVGAGLERRGEVPRAFHAAEVKVLAYVATGYARKRIDQAVSDAMESGYDGIFFDEVESTRHTYNAASAQGVKRFGAEKLVVMNAGMPFIDYRVFRFADIVSIENAWNVSLRRPGIPAWRWMAVQGDPARLAPASDRAALMRLNRFRKNGGFWYYGSAHGRTGATHVRLPPWIQSGSAFVTKAQASIPDAKQVRYPGGLGRTEGRDVSGTGPDGLSAAMDHSRRRRRVSRGERGGGRRPRPATE
jgi:hypothetical protein